ncbi:MAG: exosortase [Akkermansiaceae bacterium]|nr:exosortase [Akkermansiaceae bacterium]
MESSGNTTPPARAHAGPPSWIGPILCGLVILYFYGIVPGFAKNQVFSSLRWMVSTWNKENDYEHGYLVLPIMLGLVVWQWKRLRASVGAGSSWGLPVLFLGVLLYVAGFRCGQARLTIGGLPFVLWGSALFLWGWQTAKLLLFPIFFFWVAVHVPQFSQATNFLQILSTKLAQAGCSLFGVKTQVLGTQIFSASGKFKPLEINEGCGGIRSLMALLMISSVWAYVADISLWKKALLCLAAVPLAIFGNMLRLTSIFVISEYGNADFAAGTWHDWSGLVLFYPISLILLLFVHSVLEGGLPWKKPRKREVSQVVVRQVEAN